MSLRTYFVLISFNFSFEANYYYFSFRVNCSLKIVNPLFRQQRENDEVTERTSILDEDCDPCTGSQLIHSSKYLHTFTRKNLTLRISLLSLVSLVISETLRQY